MKVEETLVTAEVGAVQLEDEITNAAGSLETSRRATPPIAEVTVVLLMGRDDGFMTDTETMLNAPATK